MIPRRKLHKGELERLPETLLKTLNVPLPTPLEYTQAVLCARISKDRPGTSNSMLDQDEGVSRHAADYRLTVVDTIAEKGVSARYIPPWARPDLGPYFRNPRLLARWDTLVFYKIDRFFRSKADLAIMEIWLDATGRRLLCVRDNLDLSTPTGRFTAMIHVGIAQSEAETTGTRVKDTQQGLLQRGLYAGGVIPFGHRLVPSPSFPDHFEYEPHPVWSSVVETLFTRFVAGETVSALVREMNEAKVPTSRDVVMIDADRDPYSRRNADYGHTWSYDSLASVLSNPIHIGLSVVGGKEIRGEDGNILPRSKAIVSEDLFNRAQYKMKNADKRKSYVRKGGSDLLGVVICGDCWNNTYRNTATRRNKKKADTRYVYYKCANVPQRPKCKNGGVRQDVLFDLLEEFVVDNYGHLPRMEHVHIPGDNTSTELEKVTKLIEEIREEKDLGLYEGDQEAYMKRLSGYVTRQRELASQPRQEARSRYDDTGMTVRAWWASLSWSERGAWLRDCGVTVWYRKEPHKPEPELLVHGGKSWDDLMSAAQGYVSMP